MEVQKYQARREILARRRYSSTKEQHEAAEAVATYAAALKLEKHDVVALYSPIKGEVPTHLIAKELQKLGVVVAYPYALANGKMRFYAYDGKFIEDDLGIPTATGDEVSPNIIFAPLVAFDRSGNRLGYGKGYYDKALAELALASSQPIRTIGLAYSWQEMKHIPTAQHDVPLHQIWTEHEVITCQTTS